VLLAAVLVALLATAWWGYQKRESVARYAVTSMLDQQLGDLLPEGEDPTRVAIRVTAILRAIQEGRLDAERLRGGGDLFRQYYADRHMDGAEFESMLAFAEAAIER
jgi:hypothetical protein